MAARSLPPTVSLPFPKLFDPAVPEAAPEQANTRITNPAVGQLDLLSYFERVRDEHQDRVKPLAWDEGESFARVHTLPQFYEHLMKPSRDELLQTGKLKRGTLEKELQALRYFGEWDLRESPADWPADVAWPGLPLLYLTGPYLERWLAHLQRDRGLAVGSILPLWYQLRTVLNFAVKLQVLRKAPQPDLGRAIKGDEDVDEIDDLVPTTFTAAELEAVYRALDGEVEMQVAWVVGSNVGPRTVDLFGLEWDTNVRLDADFPHVFYRAVKTGKRHWVPLAEVTLKQLNRLRRRFLIPQGLIFPNLTSARNKDPESSVRARARNARLKAVLRDLGLPADDKKSDYFRPWQVLRSTCSSRLNNHRSGAGRLVTHGKDADVNSQHYWDHRDLIVEACNTLPQPAAFQL